VGEIDHLLIEKVSGRVVYAVMSFGGFLGLAHSHCPIPWSALRHDTSLGGYRTGITEAQLRDAPDFRDELVDGPRLGGTNPQALWRANLLGQLRRFVANLNRTCGSNSANKRFRHGVDVNLFAAHHDNRC
jgi:hypothetical protein